MAAPKGTRPPGGSRKGVPNKITADVKAMVAAALNQAGGEAYLVAQAHENPRAFLSLVGRLMPLQVTGADGKDLIPAEAADPQRIALGLLAVLNAAKPAGAGAQQREDGAGAPE